MELNIKRKSIKVNFEDKLHVVYAPSNALLKEYTADKSPDDMEKSISLLEKLGLPSEISWALDPESLGAIVEALMHKKKS